jgi:hypothetical protein
MSRWLEKSKGALLPCSKEQNDFYIALREWEWTGDCEDYENDSEVCELCGCEGLRYHFPIQNCHTAAVLNIGSSCIKKFDIKVVDKNGVEITKNKEAFLKGFMRTQHVQSVMDALSNREGLSDLLYQEIKGRPKWDLDDYCFEMYKKFGLDVKMLNYLFMRFAEEKIHFKPHLFSVTVRSQYEKNKLLGLSQIQFERISKALSASQRQFYLKSKNELNDRNVEHVY